MNSITPTSPRFYNSSAYVQKNQMLSRSLIDLLGITVPWAIMANNKDEAREKAVRYSVGFIIPYLTPFVTLPLSNRAALKAFKITNKYWSKNNPIIQISNKYLKNPSVFKDGLKNPEALKAGLSKLVNEIQRVNKRRNGIRKKFGFKQKELHFNFDEIVDKYKKPFLKDKDTQKLTAKELDKIEESAFENLRKDLIKAKNSVLSSDLLFTSILWSGAPWIANFITKKKTGKIGFSAEYNEKNKELVEKRAQKHEKTKDKKYGIVLSTCVAIGTLVPLAIAASLRKPNANRFSKMVAKHAKGFDYTEGIYMKKPSIFLMAAAGGFLSSLLATRDKTELRDVALRLGAVELLYFTGDGVISSLLGRIIEKPDFKVLDTNKKDLWWHRVFPPLKSMEELDLKMIEAVDDSAKNAIKKQQKVIQRLYWTGMLGLMGILGFALPYALNKLIKSDVEKLGKNTAKYNNYNFLRELQHKKLSMIQ